LLWLRTAKNGGLLRGASGIGGENGDTTKKYWKEWGTTNVEIVWTRSTHG